MEPTPKKDIDAFRKGLRQACEDAVTKRTALGDFIKTHEPPWECRGNKDRTYGFYWVTTVLKTLGEKEGVQALMDINPHDMDIETGCRVVFYKRLRDISMAAAAQMSRYRLAKLCEEMIESIDNDMVNYTDPSTVNILNGLKAKCFWIAHEFRSEAENKLPHVPKYVVTCICHGDTCDGHATTLGVVATKDAALEIIADDKQIFKENLEENELDLSDIDDRPFEIWYGTPGENGRVYDIHEI